MRRGHLGDRDWEVHKFGAHSLANLPLYERAGGLVLDYFERQDSNSSVVVVANAMDGVEQCLAAFLNSSLEMHKALHKLDEAADIQRDVLRGLERPEVTDEVEQTISADVDAIKGVVNGVAYLRAVPQELITMVNEVGHKWSALTLHAMLRSKAAPSMMIDAHSIITVADPGKNSEEQNWDPDHESPTMEVRPKWRDTSERLATWWHAALSRDETMLDAPRIVVVAGSTARDGQGAPATLGAGGSDLTASLLGRVLGARRLFIWKGQDGIFTADPSRVPEAFPIDELEYDEAMEMFCFGHPVMHPSALAPCQEADMQVEVRNVYNGAGTIINCRMVRSSPDHPSPDRSAVDPQINIPTTPLDETGQATSSSPVVHHGQGLAGCKAVTSIDEVALISVEGPTLGPASDVADRFLAALSGRNIRVLMLSQASSDCTLCVAVPRAQCAVAVSALRAAFQLELRRSQNSISVTSGMSITAIFQNGMAWRPGVSAVLMRAMAAAGISIRAIAQGSSERQVSVVVDPGQGAIALRAAHQAYSLSGRGVAVALLGSTGRVGTALTKQLKQQAKRLRGEVDLKVVAAGDKRGLALDETGRGLQLQRLEEEVKGADGMDLDKVAAHLLADGNPHRIVIDCTDSDKVADRYAEWLASGIHVITSSTLAGGGPLERYEECLAAAKIGCSQLRMGPSVGAGTGLLKHLSDMLWHGADITKVEAVLSGSLSFVFETCSPDVTFASALETAIQRGYTAVDPRADLSGLDTARRLLSVARHLSLPLQLSDIALHKPLTPERLQDWECPSNREEAGAGFMAEMKDSDFAWIDDLVREAAEEDEVLRYVAILQLQPTPVASVELRRYPKSHDLACCGTTDHVAAIYSSRLKDPMVLQGAGIGEELVAAGLSSELLRLLAEI